MHFNDQFFDTLNIETQAYIIFSYLSKEKQNETISNYLHKLRIHEKNYVNAREQMLDAIATIKEEYNK